MWFFSNQTSPGTRVSLAYITIGALGIVWTGVWFWYLHDSPPETGTVYYFATGTLVTSIVLLVIGFGVGAIARGSRPADTPAAQASSPAYIAGDASVPAAVELPPTPVVRPAVNNGPAAPSTPPRAVVSR